MKNLYKSLANFQQEVPVIHKDTQGYGYTYADLPAIFEVINPLLKKNGLGFTQLVEGKTITTIVFHIESGEVIQSNTDIPQDVSLAKMNDFQVLGSAITYIRRYALSSILGIITDKDNDGAGKQQPKDEKPWLNLFSKDGSETKAYKNLNDAIQAGKDITLSTIQGKYRVSQEVKKELESNFKIK